MKYESLIYYIDLYKLGAYDAIPIHIDENKVYYLSDKQLEALKYLNDDITLFIGYGGSGMCFHGDTLVSCIDGHKPIRDIKEGDLVLSYDKKNKDLSYKKVLKKHCFNHNRTAKLIKFIDTNLICTYGHRFLFRSKWTKAIEIKRRAMEIHWWDLLCFKRRKNSNVKSQSYREIKTNETSARRKRLFKNNDIEKREISNNKNASGNSESVYSESKQLSSNKSSEFQKRRQQGNKFGMDNNKREQSLYSRCRKILEGRKTSFKTWRRKQQIDTNRTTSKGNKRKIYTKNYNTKNVSRRIWGKRVHYKRRGFKKILEARELTLKEARNSILFESQIDTYDLTVEGFHSYTVTKENIIVHNSGKTQLLCFWLLLQSLSYDNTRWLLGRKELKNLKATTVQTLLKTFNFYGLELGTDYKYNDTAGYYEFYNKSRIILRDTKHNPGDPEFTGLGSLELTGAALDESVENTVKVINVITSRIGRWNNAKHGLKAKILEGFNPMKNHVYIRYWKPFRDKKETHEKKFVRALCTDNPHPDAITWAENVKKSGDKVLIQRLIYGNFDYEDDDMALCNFDKISDIFTNKYIKDEGQNFLSCDIAISNDHFVAIAWKGMRIKKVIRIKNISPTRIEINKEKGIVNNKIDYSPIIKILEKQAEKYEVPRSNIVYDAAGIGSPIKEIFPGAVPLRGNQVLHKEYNNIKSELEYELAKAINAGEIYCVPSAIDSNTKETMIEELQMLKRDSEPGEKLATIKTAMIKELLGWSPDIMKAMSYRMLFKLTRNT